MDTPASALADRLDPAFRVRGALALYPLGVLAAVLALLVFGSRRAALPAPGSFAFGALIALPSLLAALAALSVWSWRRLVRPAAEVARMGPWARVVYGAGVRGFGLVMAVGFAAVNLVIGLTGPRRPRDARGLLAFVVLQLLTAFVLALPLGLWGGYLWGRGMAGVRGHRRPE